MKALVVYAHPNPNSFNHAILEQVVEHLSDHGGEVDVRDLYSARWDPSLSASDFETLISGQVPDDIAREQAKVSWCDSLVLLFPIWWYGPPAILKGWLDRVFSVGFAYRSTTQGLEGLLKGRQALVISTSGADEAGAAGSHMLDSIRISLVEGTLEISGFDPVIYHNFFAVPFVTDTDRKQMLSTVPALLRELNGMPPEFGHFGLLSDQSHRIAPGRGNVSPQVPAP